jgi:hypothetical protein
MRIIKRHEKDKSCAADQKKIPANTLESSNTRQKLKRSTYRQTQSSRPVGLEVFILFTKERTNT